MNINDLRPAGSFAQQYGVKMIGYGPAGIGKTPLVNTAPNPVLVACEPGLLSMRTSQVPTWIAPNPAAISEFFQWFTQSSESQCFDTICIDSISQMAEIILEHELARNKDGRKAYGEMSRTMMGYLNLMYHMPQKHTYLIGKLGIVEEGGQRVKAPFFPGQDLNTKVVHLYDLIGYIDLARPPGATKPVPAICTETSNMMRARDRSGKLDPYEPPHLGNLFNKCMAN